jgi:GNAT superfamily N-acetyltransferase
VGEGDVQDFDHPRHPGRVPPRPLTDALSPPEPLSEAHDLESFSSGVAVLDDWLRRRARANQASGASRTFVVAEDGRVVGYYALASGAITAAAGIGRFRRNMPDPIPVAVLGRLAVDRSQQGRGLGRALFRDCALRVAQAADTIGIRGIVVHAISEEAKAFYLALGFDPSPAEPMTLMVTLADVRDLL